MYHQLCRATGRLVAASHLQSPLYPVVPVALQRVEPPAIKYTYANMSTVGDAAACPAPARRLIPGTNIPYGPVPEALRKKQEHFLKEDDVPVHLKGGPVDQILYRLTMGLCIVGLFGVVDLLYSLSFPKK